MEDEFLSKDIFVSMMRIHVSEILDLLITENTDFTILANLEGVFFEPELPSKITKHFKPMITFTLSNYTLSSAKVYGKMLQFEAGFGENNIGALVSVHLESILQLFVGQEAVFINRSIPKSFQEEFEELQADEHENKESKEDKLSKSLKAFASNPNNKKLID